MNDLGILTIGIGIAVSMICDWRTGYGSGGLVSAGTIALTLYSPLRVGVSLLAALLIWPLLDFAVGRWGLHGRARVGWAMLMALALRLAAGNFVQPLPWLGWVIPGLIAADMQRQGVVETLSALTAVSVLTAFASQWLFRLGGALS